mgnify:FL=1
MQLLPARASTLLTRATNGISAMLTSIARSQRLQLVVLGCGLTMVATTLVADHRRVESELDALGDRVVVYVAATDIDAGDTLDQTNVTSTIVPRRFRLPTALDDISGLLASHHLLAGDLLTRSNTTRSGATTIPVGWRGLTIDAGPLAERLTPGMAVDVMANGTFLVEGALVIDVVKDGHSTLIAVPQERVVAVADAASVGLAVLAIAS